MKKRASVYPVWLMLTIIIVVVLVAFLLFFLLDYKTEKPAKGYEDEIIVVADSMAYDEMRESLQSVFEKEIATPQPEKLFTLKRINLSQLEKNKRIKNLIITAPLNSGSRTSDYIKSIINSSEKTKLESDAEYIAYKNDLWAKNQMVVVLTAPDIKKLNEKILKNSDSLLYAFQKESDRRLLENLYNPANEKKNIEGKFLKDYSWVIYVQADYSVALNNPTDNFVWLKKSSGSDMKQSIFVYWIDNASPTYITADSIRVIRDRLTKKFYGTNNDSSFAVVASDDFVVKEVNFNGRYSLFTQGLWEAKNKGLEGPFVNYFFYDEKTQRIYMLDGSIYAPKYYKRNLIQQMDVTLQSFKIKAELSKDRIEELLDAAKD